MSANKLKIKKDDEVIVISGKDKGKTGAVLAVDPKSRKVKVAGVAIASKHKRPTQQSAGGIVKEEAFIDISNVAIVVDGKPVKVGYVTDKDGNKVRKNRANGEVL